VAANRAMFIVVTNPRFTIVYVDVDLPQFQEPTPETRLIFKVLTV
ncbi:uncharacterized protein METZ01_LOCUS511488, partial [marine metagenome]